MPPRRNRSASAKGEQIRCPANSADLQQSILIQSLQNEATKILTKYQQKQQQQQSWFDIITDHLKTAFNNHSSSTKEDYNLTFFDDVTPYTLDENLLLGFALHKWYGAKNAEDAHNSLSRFLQDMCLTTRLQRSQTKSLAKALLPKTRYDSLKRSQDGIFNDVRHDTILPEYHSLATRDTALPSYGKLLPSPSVQRVLSVAKEDLVASRVLIVGGSSGSGKTVFSFHVAKQANAQIEVVSKDDNTKGVIYSTCSHFAGWWAEHESLFGTPQITDIEKQEQILFNLSFSPVEHAVGDTLYKRRCMRAVISGAETPQAQKKRRRTKKVVTDAALVKKGDSPTSAQQKSASFMF